MEKFQLKCLVREINKLSPEKLRKVGKIPAVLYGHNLQNRHLTVELAEFERILKKAGESTIVELTTDDGKTHPVLIHAVQYHYLTSLPTHVDFYEVSMTEKLKAEVALEFTGESKAVKEAGGVLVKILNNVEVQCLPGDLPHNLTVDISAIKTFSDSIHVKDLVLPPRVELVTSGEEVIAKVQPPRDVEAELAAEVKPVEDVSQVEGAAETPAGTEGEATKKEESKKE